MNASEKLSSMIREDILRRSLKNYRDGLVAAGGELLDDEVPPAFASGKDREFWDGDAWWRWTTEKDGKGQWWSFRMIPGNSLTPHRFEMFESHKQRQGAKTWARTSALNRRDDEPEALMRLLP